MLKTAKSIKMLLIFLLIIFFQCNKENLLTGPQNYPPSCNISQPKSMTTVFPGDSVIIEVNASDIDGRIENVQFYIDDKLEFLDVDTPYVYTWYTISTHLGNNIIKVIAKDEDGATTQDRISIKIKYIYKIPDNIGDGWETASVTDVGLDSAKFSELIDKIYGEEFKFLYSLIIVKDGKLILEGYPGSNRDTKHNVMSVAKSFISALIGIAIDKGFINGVKEPLFNLFPEYRYLNNEQKEKILLEHLLTMSAGFEWNELDVSYTSPENDIHSAFQSDDLIKYVLQKHVTNEPGDIWKYNSGLTNILTRVIHKTTGIYSDEFAEKNLFSPLGITDFYWDRTFYGMNSGLLLRTRDMAKFGQLYLQKGVWNGEQIISKGWVKESVKGQIGRGIGGAYGYLWWIGYIDDFITNAAVGYCGQRIINVPEINMIIVTSKEYSFNELDRERISKQNKLLTELINDIFKATK